MMLSTRSLLAKLKESWFLCSRLPACNKESSFSPWSHDVPEYTIEEHILTRRLLNAVKIPTSKKMKKRGLRRNGILLRVTFAAAAVTLLMFSWTWDVKSAKESSVTVKQAILSMPMVASDLLGDSTLVPHCDCTFRHHPEGGMCTLHCKNTLKTGDVLLVCVSLLSTCPGDMLMKNLELVNVTELPPNKPTVLALFFSDENLFPSKFRERSRSQITDGHRDWMGPLLWSQCHEMNERERADLDSIDHSLIDEAVFVNIAHKFGAKKIYSRNTVASHPLMKGSVPIGVFKENARRFIDARNQLRLSAGTDPDSKLLLYANFAVEASERACLMKLMVRKQWSKFATIHLTAPDQALKDELFASGEESPEELSKLLLSKQMSPSEYYKTLSSYAFSISPRGYGLDCFRTWESLYLGVIPIVLKRSPTHDAMYDGLPVLLVSSYEDINESFLRAELARLQAQQYTYESLYQSYWVQEMKKIQ